MFVLGATIQRCSNCESRHAAWQGFRLEQKAEERDNTILVVFLAVGGGLLFCAAVALWALRHAHRWPF